MLKIDPLFKKKWAKSPLLWQLANIGSEVNRALYWQKKRDQKNRRLAAERALIFLDLTIESLGKSYRLQEMLRLREVLVDYFWGCAQYSISALKLKTYFLDFALLARR